MAPPYPVRLRIAQVSPLYESVPPKLYGGTERVVSYVTEELVELGHDVTLFASGDSETSARLIPCCPKALRLRPDCIDQLAHHFVMLEEIFERAEEFDIIHFHIDYLHFPLSRISGIPQLTTLHGRLDLPDLPALYHKYPDMPVVSCVRRNLQPGPLNTYRRWLERKRQIRKGETGTSLCMPMPFKRTAHADDTDEEPAKPQTHNAFRFRAYWFVLAQTDGEESYAASIPSFDLDTALRTLHVTRTAFDEMQVFDVIGERTEELGVLVETNEKELILWIGSIKKLEGGFLGFAEFVGHAAAKIQDDADGNRHIFGGEIHNFLLDVVFEDAEVVRGAHARAGRARSSATFGYRLDARWRAFGAGDHTRFAKGASARTPGAIGIRD
jgi:glycosyltransferase involved in cell wall biosynthesis